MLQKMLFNNCHVKFIFPMALAVAGSALGLILFCFHSVCCFIMPEKILVFIQIILFWKIKVGGEIERICRTFFQGFLGPVNGTKNSFLNSVSNINVKNRSIFQSEFQIRGPRDDIAKPVIRVFLFGIIKLSLLCLVSCLCSI